MDPVSAKIVWSRVILGYAIAPLVVPFAYFGFAAMTGRDYGMSELTGTLLNYGPYAYLFALVLGVPAFWLLRTSGYSGLWSYALAAGVIGLIGSGLLSRIGLLAEGVLVGTLAGMLAGAVFHFVALR